jgi:hypothetical protein
MAGAPSLLLIGESHYLPEGKPAYDAPTWYASSDRNLTDEEKEHLNTAKLLKDACERGFKKKGESIWRESFKVINDYGPNFPEFKEVGNHIAFYNFFLRPASRGNSLKGIITSEDVKYANEAFEKHVEDLKPSGVIFLSVLAYERLWPHLRCSVPSIVATPHPGCPWWNRRAPKYGKKSGREILAEFVNTKTTWLQNKNA